MLASLFLAAVPAVLPVPAQDCLAPALTFDTSGLQTVRVAISGKISYALQQTATGSHIIDVRGPLVTGLQPPTISTIAGTQLLSNAATKFAGLTTDGRGVQAIVADPTTSRAAVAEWQENADGHWSETTLVLSGETVPDGDNLVFDGRRWAALSVTEPGDVFLDLIVRSATGKLEILETLPLAVSNAIAPDRPTAVALDGRLLVARVTADSFAGTFVLEDVPGAGWSLEATLPEVFLDAVPTTAAIAISGERVAVARDLGNSFQQHVVMIYSRNPVTGAGWNPFALLELPGETTQGLDRRNIQDVKFQGENVWVSQSLPSGLTGYAPKAPGGDYGRVGIVRGVGGPIAATDHWIATLTAKGSAFVGSGAFDACPALYVR